MVFSRRPERFADWVSTAWARRFSWDDLEPEEERWGVCYPPDDTGDPFGCYRGIFEEMVLRRHEARTLQAIEDTVARLGTLREGRKAVRADLGGLADVPARPAPRPRAAAGLGAGLRAPAAAAAGHLRRAGREAPDRRGPEEPAIADVRACDTARLRLALLDNESDYRRLLDRANRETVSFYPIDPRGLAVFDTPIDAVSPTGAGRGGVIDEMGRVQERLETLHNLASATDGFVSESNDFNASMKRIADDLSEYYLLGYNSTNAKLDGKFRRITVRVRRPGVQVRARRGYLAATEAEVSANAAPPPPADPAVRVRETALAALGTAPVNRAVRLVGGYEWRTSAEGARNGCDAVGGRRAWGVGSPAARVAGRWRCRDHGHRRGRYRRRVRSRALVADIAGVRVEFRRPAPRDWRVPGRGNRSCSSWSGRHGDRSDEGQPAATGCRRGQAARYAAGLSPRPVDGHGVRADGRLDVPARRATASQRVAGTGPGDLSARLLDRRGQTLGVPVAIEAREEDGQHVVVADATLASLAPGDYVVEVTVGDGGARHSIIVAFRIVP